MKTTQPTPSTHERSEIRLSAPARSEASAPKVAHTPGPWEYGRSILRDLGEPPHVWHGELDRPDLRTKHWVRIDGANYASCALALGETMSEVRANARLIAAAPELLAACQAIAALADGRGRQNLVMCAGQARAAIARATASDPRATNP